MTDEFALLKNVFGVEEQPADPEPAVFQPIELHAKPLIMGQPLELAGDNCSQDRTFIELEIERNFTPEAVRLDRRPPIRGVMRIVQRGPDSAPTLAVALALADRTILLGTANKFSFGSRRHEHEVPSSDELRHYDPGDVEHWIDIEDFDVDAQAVKELALASGYSWSS